MKRKVTGASQSNNKTPTRTCDKQQQRLPQNFIGKPLLEDSEDRLKSILPSVR